MSDKRRRYRKGRIEEKQTQKTITIAKREEPTTTESAPRILLKPKTSQKDIKEDDNTENISSEPSSTLLSNSSTTKEIQVNVEQNIVSMTRPATILSSTGVVSTNVKKLLRENSDFFCVGVLGYQGVGKSTILNLLANEDTEFDYYQRIFIDEDSFFPTKIKQHKNPSRSRTESTHMFITSDRLILLDGAPLMCNAYKKDMTTDELDNIRSIVNFLSVCHLVIIVYKDSLNINFMRLLRLAELMKPPNACGSNNVAHEYFPNLIFVKNRAKRMDFSISEIKQTNTMLQAFFKDSKIRIQRGQSLEQQLRLKKSNRNLDYQFQVNSFVFPEVKDSVDVPFHKPLSQIIDDLRWLVFTTPRNEISNGTIEFTELAWFDLFEKTAQSTQHFFFNKYDEIHRNHFDIGNAGSNGNTRDNPEN